MGLHVQSDPSVWKNLNIILNRLKSLYSIRLSLRSHYYPVSSNSKHPLFSFSNQPTWLLHSYILQSLPYSQGTKSANWLQFPTPVNFGRALVSKGSNVSASSTPVVAGYIDDWLMSSAYLGQFGPHFWWVRILTPHRKTSGVSKFAKSSITQPLIVPIVLIFDTLVHWYGLRRPRKSKSTSGKSNMVDGAQIFNV